MVKIELPTQELPPDLALKFRGQSVQLWEPAVTYTLSRCLDVSRILKLLSIFHVQRHLFYRDNVYHVIPLKSKTIMTVTAWNCHAVANSNLTIGA